jgi:hypothetical protein
MSVDKSPALELYPNASYEILPKEYLSSVLIAEMTLEQEGRFMRSLDYAAVSGNFAFLRQFDFIGKIFKGTSKRESIAPSIRKQVLSAGKCAYCGATENLTVDHIIPYSITRKHELNNLQCLCAPCNMKKGAKIK